MKKRKAGSPQPFLFNRFSLFLFLCRWSWAQRILRCLELLSALKASAAGTCLVDIGLRDEVSVADDGGRCDGGGRDLVNSEVGFPAVQAGDRGGVSSEIVDVILYSVVDW